MRRIRWPWVAAGLWCVPWLLAAAVLLANKGRIERECLSHTARAAADIVECRHEEAEDLGSITWVDDLAVALMPAAVIAAIGAGRRRLRTLPAA